MPVKFSLPKLQLHFQFLQFCSTHLKDSLTYLVVKVVFVDVVFVDDKLDKDSHGVDVN